MFDMIKMMRSRSAPKKSTSHWCSLTKNYGNFTDESKCQQPCTPIV